MGRAKANFLPLGEETYTIAVRMTLNINVAHIVHHSFFFILRCINYSQN